MTLNDGGDLGQLTLNESFILPRSTSRSETLCLDSEYIARWLVDVRVDLMNKIGLDLSICVLGQRLSPKEK